MNRAGALAAALLAAAVAVALVVLGVSGGDDHPHALRVDEVARNPTARSTTSVSLAPPATTTTSRPSTTTRHVPAQPAADVHLVRRSAIGGHISPKSVVASGHGLVFAQNMMYTHTITVYDAATASLRATIPDGVDLASFGVAGHPGISRGAPVEAAFTHDGRDAYVTNYSMYGANWGPEGSDGCGGPAGLDPSFVYRVDTQKLAIDQVIQVGMVPKYVAVTPDDRRVLVTNWCSFDLSVIDRAAGREVRRIPIGKDPRGIAISRDSRTAYIAVMGGTDIAVVDLRTFEVSHIWGVGSAPRHLVLSHDGRTLYVTLNGNGDVAAVDVATRRVVRRVHTGTQPRSIAISADGTALYVVNYESSDVSVLRTSDLSVVQTLPTGTHPIGITYEPTTGAVWVACYTGSILVFAPSA